MNQFYETFVEQINREFNADNTLYYLLETRDLIKANPERISMIDEPRGFLEMLNYLIKYWKTDNRDEALDVLADQEAKINKTHPLKTHENLKQRWFFRDIRKSIKNGGNKFLYSNPLIIAARNGFLVALLINYNRMADRLKFGFIPKAEAIKKGFSLEDLENSKKTVIQVEKIYADFGGSSIDLKNAALSKISLGEDDDSISADSTTAIISAAGGIIKLILNILAKNKAKSEPDEDNEDSEDDENSENDENDE